MIEIAIGLIIVGILAAIAIPAYWGYLEKTKISQCILDIKTLEGRLKTYELEKGLPDSLSIFSGYPFLDPWGNPYRYLNITTDNPPRCPNARRDRNNHPLSSDFDLYSMGADGLTVKQVTVSYGADDIVRADNGRYIGLGRNF